MNKNKLTSNDKNGEKTGDITVNIQKNMTSFVGRKLDNNKLEQLKLKEVQLKKKTNNISRQLK